MLNTTAQTGEKLQCSRRTVYKLIGLGELESILVGRLRRIPDDSIEEFIRRRKAAEVGGGA
jgi:excisionase family DNA binding protein